MQANVRKPSRGVIKTKWTMLGATFAPHHHHHRLWGNPPNVPSPHRALADLLLNPHRATDQQEYEICHPFDTPSTPGSQALPELHFQDTQNLNHGSSWAWWEVQQANPWRSVTSTSYQSPSSSTSPLPPTMPTLYFSCPLRSSPHDASNNV